MSEKKDQEYFSDGLSEELIDMLTKVPDLRVPARTSSFYFKGKQATIADIAKALGVAHLLEGSVRRSGNTVRITVQLIRADSGYHIWSETYDRQLGDLFKIQDDIANSVIRALKMSLLNGTPSPAPKTANSDAYTLELKGRYFLNRRGTGGIDKAVDYLQQAVKLDPNFAEGWARLSTALMVRSQGLGLTPWRSAREEALAAAERALALDPNLAYAHLAIARIRFVDGKWQEAQESYERARSLDPNRGLEVGAWLAQSRGELDEAIQLLERHAVQEPLDVYSYNALADVYYQAGRLPEAEATARKAVELEPSAVGVPVMLGQILVARGAAEEGIAEIKRDPDERNRNYGLAWAFQTLGRKADADAALSDLERTSATTLPSSIAAIYAMRNERDQAFAWLERAYQHQDDLSDLAVDPDFKNLRDDPRFKAFLRKMNLPE
jgi:TolB-like protein/Tfp pilus assembly protein PilF